MSKFIEIPREFMAEIAIDSERTPNLYYSGNLLMRRIFWQRLYLLNHLICRHAKKMESCLDFGGGGGVMLPTLAQRFDQVTLLDLDVAEAQRVVQYYHLNNVKILQQDVATSEFPAPGFNIIIAADVLEHFRELSTPITALHRWLSPDGLLFTSLPTENWIYVMLRKLFGVTKPIDHYHTGYEVETYLAAHGFAKVVTAAAPLYFQIAPLFLISAWRKRQ